MNEIESGIWENVREINKWKRKMRVREMREKVGDERIEKREWQVRESKRKNRKRRVKVKESERRKRGERKIDT